MPVLSYRDKAAMCLSYGTFKLSCCRQWAAVAKKWRNDLSIGGRAVTPKKYVQHLLAYENHLSQDAPEREIGKAQQARAAKPAVAPKTIQVSTKLFSAILSTSTMVNAVEIMR